MVQSRKKNRVQKKEATSETRVPSSGDKPVQEISALAARVSESFEEVMSEVEDYAIILLDAEGTILTWNKGAEKIEGYSGQDVIGKNHRIFYTNEDRQLDLCEKLLEIARKDGRINYEGWSVRKDGTRFWCSATLTALHNDDKTIRGFLKVTRDLTEKKIAEDKYSNFVEELRLKNEDLTKSEALNDRKKAQDALKATVAQLDLKNKTLERVNEELSSFTHVASHDMKEPLRKIHIYAARIQEAGFDPARSGEYLQKIIASALGLQRLIDHLLSYSQVSNDTTAFQPVDLNRILDSVRSDLEIAITEKKAVINSHHLPVVNGIAYQLQQLFLNLLSNSIKFAKSDEPPSIVITSEVIKGPEIPGVSTDGLNKYHHIAIADNGIGFPQESNSKIFDAFERLHMKEKYPGTGIGLAIVKKIIQNHNGIISAEGVPGEGATFHLYFPV